ncbi:Phosphatidylinositol 4-kinase LSB6 [Marasmius crinis-equi]|uniref:Phosphatidylinositol 4-kinase n=1 Tax=Marasmius crinis-equi TaxID=585013 RepID=A0ABR3FHW4_9AGAR
MPRAGYQPLAQSIEEEEEDVVVQDQPFPNAVKPATRGLRRPGRPGHIDLTKLDTAFKRWTESIAQKVKRKKKAPSDHTKKQIWRSVFEPVVLAPSTQSTIVKTLDHKAPMTQAEFDILIRSVKTAISEGIHPKMIVKGSSGSYFARAKDEQGHVRTVACVEHLLLLRNVSHRHHFSVFKPKDEEPYGRLNPKTTKWLHRQFRWIIPFGRACLIPNLSYISEAAASFLDERLNLHIVPPTRLVSLSSPAFFYDWLDRNAAKKGKPLPDKIGSMQYALPIGLALVFKHLKLELDASDFLRKHPWPGRAIADTFDDSTHRRGSVSKRFLGAMKVICGRTGDNEDVYDDYEDERLFDATEATNGQGAFYWSATLQQSFREELEKLVILDYLMLNTDRGADNYMIKYCEGETEKLVDVAPGRSVRHEMPLMSELRRSETSNATSQPTATPQPTMRPSSSYTCPEEEGDYRHKPHIHIAAIDNSLSFPHEHPQGWRSYTYGWLYLPVSIIGRPFSEKTRNHFLPLLTSKVWWEETSYQLQKLFAVDPDFNLKMFKVKVIPVRPAQCANLVPNSDKWLLSKDEGPLELTRRTKILVWDDEIEVAEGPDLDTPGTPGNPSPVSPKLSISSVPLPRPRRQSSASDNFPPPMRRTSTDASGAPRPVPFAAKFQRIHPGTTGVTMLEHLERLDAVEVSLQRLTIEEEEAEVDVGESSSSARPVPSSNEPRSPSAPTSPFSPPGSPPQLPTVHEADPDVDDADDSSSVSEEDLVALSKSTSHVEPGPSRHTRWVSETNQRGMEWLRDEPDTPSTRLVIVESLRLIGTGL